MRRIAGPIVALSLAGALVALLIAGLAQKGSDHTLDDAVAKGRRPVAPDRALPVLGGTGSLTLASFRGRVVVLNFWASWCDPCRAEAPLLERAQRRLLRDHAGTVLGVTYRDATPDSQAFVRKFGLTYPSVRDVDGDLAKAYGTRALPETFVIDRRGRIAALSRGQVNGRFLAHAVTVAEGS
jgi:cytochrome c biogenesis protein CcmG/thiol:disulfide interchange protein DsbE